MTAAERQAKYRQQHPEKVKAANREYQRKRTADGYQRRRRLENLEKARAYARAYQKAHPESYRIGAARRRARIAGGGGSHSAEQWILKLREFGGRCAYCGGPAECKDHVYPISLGGTDDIGNVVPACMACNRSKGSKLLEDWLRTK